ncbi:MAG: Trk system potassium transporter TrkA [Rubrobacteraceae bacterium]
MQVVVVGAGEVGFNVAQMLSQEGHEVVVVDEDAKRVAQVADQLDALVMRGNGASPKVLDEAGIKKTDLVVAATNLDEVNITSCLAAKHHGVERTVARIHDPDYYPEDPSFAKDVLGIDFVIHTEQVAAEEIKAALLVPGAINVDTFAGGRIEVAEVVLQEDSPAVGCSVRDVGLPERALILGGVRNGEPLMSRGDTVLDAEDHIFLIAEHDYISESVSTVTSDTEPVEDVIILGGGRIGLRLALALEDLVSLKVVEGNAERAKYVATQLENGLVIHESDLSRDFLVREAAGNTDAFIAMTSDDRTNMLASMYARQLGSRLTIAGINRGEFSPLAEKLGVDITVSPRLLAAGAISRFVRRGDVVAVSLLESGAQMIELRVPEKCVVAGQPLSELNFPKEAIVGMVLRDDETIIPKGQDVLEPGDDVVVFTTNTTVEKVENLFSSS